MKTQRHDLRDYDPWKDTYDQAQKKGSGPQDAKSIEEALQKGEKFGSAIDFVTGGTKASEIAVGATNAYTDTKKESLDWLIKLMQ